MPRPSLRHALIDELTRRARELEQRLEHGDAPASIGDLVAVYREDVRRLEQLGDLPLPSWAMVRASQLGLPRHSTSSAALTT